MLSWYAGKWRRHPNGGSIRFQHQHSLSAQPEVGFANVADVSANAVAYNLQRRPLPGLGEMPIDRQFRLHIETHGSKKVRGRKEELKLKMNPKRSRAASHNAEPRAAYGNTSAG